jgi:hypothetical protein
LFHLPRDIRSANAMRSAINERALRNGSRESDRIHAVCEGLRHMVLGGSSAMAAQLGWQQLRDGVFTHIPHRGDAA